MGAAGAARLPPALPLCGLVADKRWGDCDALRLRDAAAAAFWGGGFFGALDDDDDAAVAEVAGRCCGGGILSRLTAAASV